GAGQGDRVGAQRVSACRGRKGGGVRPREGRLRQGPRERERLHGDRAALAADQPGAAVHGRRSRPDVPAPNAEYGRAACAREEPGKIQTLVADAVARGFFPTPAHPGVDYMLSTENRVPNAKGVVTSFPPHVMLYGTKLTNADLGVDMTDLDPDG